MSRAQGDCEGQVGDSPEQGTEGALEGHDVTEAPANLGLANPSLVAGKSESVPSGDSNCPVDELRFGKQNAKQNAKHRNDDPTLEEVIKACPDLSEPIKAAIMALIGNPSSLWL